MSRTELLDEVLVILSSSTAPEPADGESGIHNPGHVADLSVRVAGEVSNRSVTGLGELVDGEAFHIEPHASNAWVSSRSAVRSDTGEVAWRLTPKAISRLFGSPNPPYRRVDEILGLQALGNVEREQGGTSKP